MKKALRLTAILLMAAMIFSILPMGVSAAGFHNIRSLSGQDIIANARLADTGKVFESDSMVKLLLNSTNVKSGLAKLSTLSGNVAAPIVAANETAEAGDKVEILFKVGDSTLMINGSPVTVETPFIVEGTTMVPLRVITEAFGAEVNWEGETKTITLLYDDVTIILQIGNKIAMVNGFEEELLEAPVLSENGFTMVPLRFISETFGADVGWDAATSGITVVKEKIGNDTTVTASITAALVGDSYYNWQIDRPKNMSLEYRSFDGTATGFAGEEDNVILLVEVMPRFDFFNLDMQFDAIKEDFSKFTIMKADKTPGANGAGMIHLQAKDREDFIEVKCILTDKFLFMLTIVADVKMSNEDIKPYSDILDTFKTNFDKNADVHDFSNVENGFRLYQDSKYQIEFKVPAAWLSTSNVDKENVLYFDGVDSRGSSTGYMELRIYSKPSGMTTEQWATKEQTELTRYRAKATYKSSAVKSETISGINASSYEIEYMDGTLKTGVLKDMFMYLGDYAYNLTVYSNLKSTAKNEDIVNSFKIAELSSTKIGSLLFEFEEVNETLTTQTNTSPKWNIQLNSTWVRGKEVNSGYALFDHKPTGSYFEIGIVPDIDANRIDFSQLIESVYKDNLSRDGYSKVTDAKTISAGGGRKVYKYTVKYTHSNGAEEYLTHYLFQVADKLFDAYLIVPSKGYHDGPLTEEIEKALGTVKI